MSTVVCRSGRSEGAQWAENASDVDAVRARIAEFERLFPDGILTLLVNVSDSYTPSERLYMYVIIDGPDNGTRQDANEFWAASEDANDIDYLLGFADGIMGR